MAPPDPIHPLPPRLGNRRNPTARQRPRAEAARRPGERAGGVEVFQEVIVSEFMKKGWRDLVSV